MYWADEWKAKEDELLKSCQRTYQAALERDADIVYDSIGVGASAGATFSEKHAWWLVVDSFRNTFNTVKNGEQYLVDELISID